MPKIAVAAGASVHCTIDDYLWPWQRPVPVPVLMMHGFARNAAFWDRVGAGDCRNPPHLPARPARLRRVRRTATGLRHHAGSHRRADHSRARQPRPRPGALGRRVVGRDHRVTAGGDAAGAHRQPSSCATRRPGSRTRSNASMRSTAAAPARRCGPTASAHGAGRRSATASISIMPHRNYRTGVVSEMDRTRPDVAAAMHDCFESVDTMPVLPRVTARS